MSDAKYWLLIWLIMGAMAALVGWKRVYSQGVVRTRWWLLAVTIFWGPFGWWIVWPALEDDDYE